MKIQVVRFEIKPTFIEVGKLTNKQLEYVNLIEEYKVKNKKVPSFRQICKLINCNSPSSAFTMMNKLYKKGYDYRVI